MSEASFKGGFRAGRHPQADAGVSGVAEVTKYAPQPAVSEPVRVKVGRDWGDDTFELIFKREEEAA